MCCMYCSIAHCSWGSVFWHQGGGHCIWELSLVMAWLRKPWWCSQPCWGIGHIDVLQGGKGWSSPPSGASSALPQCSGKTTPRCCTLGCFQLEERWKVTSSFWLMFFLSSLRKRGCCWDVSTTAVCSPGQVSWDGGPQDCGVPAPSRVERVDEGAQHAPLWDASRQGSPWPRNRWEGRVPG